MIIKRVDFSDFLEEFKRYGREEAFSYQGKKALFEYLNELAKNLEEPLELDVVAICCDFIEYENLEQFNDDYGLEDIEDIEDISFYTTVIKIDEDSFIIQNF